MSLLVIGTLAYDDIETAHDSRQGVLGGSATYCAVAASHFVDPRLVGVVGEDFAESDSERLREAGVSTEGLEVVYSNSVLGAAETGIATSRAAGGEMGG